MSSDGKMTPEIANAIADCRAAEKEQAVYYRALAALAEAAGDEDLSQRFHGLHADEQHHLSRLTARLLELGGHPPDLSHIAVRRTELAAWEGETRRREEDELRRYQALVEMDLDPATRELVEEILGVEHQHVRELGGKWTPA